MRERKLDKTMPDSLRTVMTRIGDDLAAARKVREMTQQELADRMHVSRRLVSRMESGDHKVSFGAYAAAAWLMGLEKNLLDVFDQEKDPVYQRNTRLELGERVRHKSAEDPSLDF